MRNLWVTKIGFGDKGVIVEPIKQLLTKGGNHIYLRIVDMSVNKAWHDKLVLIIVNLYGRFALLCATTSISRHNHIFTAIV